LRHRRHVTGTGQNGERPASRVACKGRAAQWTGWQARVNQAAGRHGIKRQGVGGSRRYKVTIDIEDQLRVIRDKETHVAICACGHDGCYRLDPAVKGVECGDQRLRLSAWERRQKSEWAVRNHRYIEGISLRCSRYIANAAWNGEPAGGLSAQERPAKRAIWIPRIGDSTRRCRKKPEAQFRYGPGHTRWRVNFILCTSDCRYQKWE